MERTQESGAQLRGGVARHGEALAEAHRLAEADQPSPVAVDDRDGAIVERTAVRQRSDPGAEFSRVSALPLPSERGIRLKRGDITRLGVDAIVNAANSSLLGGGGVDGAIHRAAGPELLAECRMLGGCPAGEARLTLGYRLPARHVIHTVGPVWRGGAAGERETLARCYRACLMIARDQRFRDIAFPAIATGAYGFPHAEAARIAVAAARAHLAVHEAPERVIFVCFDDAALAAYRGALGLDAR